MYRISGYGWPKIIRPFFSNPVPAPAPVPAKTVPGTGYLSRIVLGPFWQLVHPANGRHIVNTLDVNKDKVVRLHVVVLKWKMSDSRKSSAICECFCVDSTNVSVALCKLCNSKLSRGGNLKIFSTFFYSYHKVNKKIRYYATSIQISGSGSGRIVCLVSGIIRF